MAIGFSVLAFGSGTLENKPVVWFPQLTGEANRDVVVRNVCDRDRRGPPRGGDRRLGSAGDGSRRDGAVAARASRTSPAPPRGLSSPAGARRASRSSPAPPRGLSGRLDSTLPQAPIRRCTRGAALTASRYTHHSTRNTRRERLKADQGSSVPGRARREGRRAAAVNGRAMSAWSFCD